MTQPPSNESLGQRSQPSEFPIGTVIDAIPGLVWSALPVGNLEFCSQGLLDYAGMSLEEVRGKEFAALVHPQEKSDFVEKWGTALAHGHSFQTEARIRRADGCYRWFLIRALPLREASGKIHRWYGTNVEIEDLKRAQEEITERKRAEEQLLESETRFQVMADTAPVLIWMTGTDALCNYFNKPWLEFTGRTMEQEVGSGWTEGVHPDDVQGCFDVFLPAFHARRPFRMEYRLKRADGEYRWVIESGIPRYAGGEFAGYIGSNIDITDLKRAAEESERLRQVKSELAHLNRVTTMGELAASIAHEIKQPISAAHTNAKTCLRWLGRDQPDIEEAREAVSRIVQDVTRASEIISRIRGLFKQEESERGSLDVNEVIGEMISLLRSEAGRHAISVHAELAPDLPKVNADRVQLQQVLMNLMLNGIEAISEGKAEGQLTIRSQRNPEDLVLISVSDTGVGLPSDRAHKVFDAFFTTKPQGTGMGLSLSRSIIEAHGGRLWATGNPDRGATFQFTLPIEQAWTATA
ncbi:MAG TPA: PAS domain-containing protein [Verrucomicrobiae bacterium]|jgi:PAS domain S-box-containing protein|nr:PAS domain-containing protein [Verrucomicrobiae bacterium]